MRIMITDSRGDSISITIGDNGSFRELNKCLETSHEKRMNFTNLQNKESSELDENTLTRLSNNCLKKSVAEADNSNLKLLEEQVNSCLNQIQIEPGKGCGIKNSDIKISISSENNEISNSKSLCRLCATRGNDMVYVFGSNEQYKNIIEKIEDCLPIMVTKTDTLPKEACLSCLEKLELCHKFHKTVADAEKHFLILGGKISYDSEKMTKYCQTVSKDSRARSSSIGDENVVNLEGTSTFQGAQRTSYSAPNSPICAVNSEEESSFEERISDPQSNKAILISEGDKRRRNDSFFGEGDEAESLAGQSGDSKIIHCLICGEGFQNIKKCHTHSRIHFTENYYPCSLCNEIFTIEKDWSEHGIEHKEGKKLENSSETIHVCNKCGKIFVSEARLQFHIKYHDPNAKPCYCEICDKILDSESTLYQHLQTVHGQRKEFRCEICGKQFRAQASVNAHQRKHRYVRSFECTICNKRFYSNDTLEMHKETHSKSLENEKNFSCVYCGKSFTQKLPLTVHIMSHTESQSPVCDASERSNGMKRKRDDRRRPDPGDRPFKCSVCERTFDHSARLREHASVHTGKRPYSCSLCDKSFKRANARKVHMIIHTGEKPYQCDMCGTNFRRAGDMRRHKKTQHGQNE